MAHLKVKQKTRGLHGVLGWVAAALGSVLLASCGGDEVSRVICPQAGVLYDANRLSVFGPGPEKNLENLAYDAEIGDVSIECKYDDEIVKSEIRFSLDLRAGPAARPGKQKFRYFVALTELNSTVLSKKIYTEEVDFDVEKGRFFLTKKVSGLKIDYKRLGRGDLYEILVGWELTPDQLAYNRTHTPFDRPNLRRVLRP